MINKTMAPLGGAFLKSKMTQQLGGFWAWKGVLVGLTYKPNRFFQLLDFQHIELGIGFMLGIPKNSNKPLDKPNGLGYNIRHENHARRCSHEARAGF